MLVTVALVSASFGACLGVLVAALCSAAKDG